MNIRLYIAAVALAVAATAYGQPMMPPGGIEGARGPMERGFHGCSRHEWTMGANFFMPEMVIRHQKEIGLTDDQRSAIKTEMENFATRVVDLRWQLSTEKGDLADLLSQAKPDEKAILAKEEKLLKAQGDLKLARLTMFIRIKNVLTPDQQDKLTELRKQMEHHPWGGRMMMGHGPMRMGHGEMGSAGEHPANPK